jgi:hypothetical protein
MCTTTRDKSSSSPGPGGAAGAHAGSGVPQDLRDSVTAKLSFKNPLNDPAVATVLTQKINKTTGTPGPVATAEVFNEEDDYRLYVPKKLATDFANAPAGSKPTARVSLFFGVGPEMSLFRLRPFFSKSTNSVLVTIPGVEDGWDGVFTPFGKGIATDMIDQLFTEAGLAGITFSVEVMAGYSTGYRGLNLTIINELVDLTGLTRVIYLDAWYHHDDHPVAASGPYVKKNTLWAVDTSLSKSPAAKIVIYAFTHPGGVPRSNPGQTNQNIENPPREPVANLYTKYPANMNFIDFEFKFKTRNAIDDGVEKICLARLLKLGIASGKIEESAVAPALKTLMDALPERGSFGTLGLAGYTDLYAWVASHTSEISGFSITQAMKLVTDKNLLGSWTDPSHYEMRHREFVLELGKEPLLP